MIRDGGDDDDDDDKDGVDVDGGDTNDEVASEVETGAIGFTVNSCDFASSGTDEDGCTAIDRSLCASMSLLSFTATTEVSGI
jgi:hypothetical protein